jgi:transcription initiation factor IIF auxiliary subunit
VKIDDSFSPNDLVIMYKQPYHITRRGWGEFPVYVTIYFKNKELNKPFKIKHELTLDQKNLTKEVIQPETHSTFIYYKVENDEEVKVNEMDSKININNDEGVSYKKIKNYEELSKNIKEENEKELNNESIKIPKNKKSENEEELKTNFEKEEEIEEIYKNKEEEIEKNKKKIKKYEINNENKEEENQKSEEILIEECLKLFPESKEKEKERGQKIKTYIYENYQKNINLSKILFFMKNNKLKLDIISNKPQKRNIEELIQYYCKFCGQKHPDFDQNICKKRQKIIPKVISDILNTNKKPYIQNLGGQYQIPNENKNKIIEFYKNQYENIKSIYTILSTLKINFNFGDNDQKIICELFLSKILDIFLRNLISSSFYVYKDQILFDLNSNNSSNLIDFKKIMDQKVLTPYHVYLAINKYLDFNFLINIFTE